MCSHSVVAKRAGVADVGDGGEPLVPAARGRNKELATRCCSRRAWPRTAHAECWRTRLDLVFPAVDNGVSGIVPGPGDWMLPKGSCSHGPRGDGVGGLPPCFLLSFVLFCIYLSHEGRTRKINEAYMKATSSGYSMVVAGTRLLEHRYRLGAWSQTRRC